MVPNSRFVDVCKFGIDLLALTLFQQWNSNRTWLTGSALLFLQAMLDLTKQTTTMKAADFESPGMAPAWRNCQSAVAFNSQNVFGEQEQQKPACKPWWEIPVEQVLLLILVCFLRIRSPNIFQDYLLFILKRFLWCLLHILFHLRAWRWISMM